MGPAPSSPKVYTVESTGHMVDTWQPHDINGKPIATLLNADGSAPSRRLIEANGMDTSNYRRPEDIVGNLLDKVFEPIGATFFGVDDRGNVTPPPLPTPSELTNTIMIVGVVVGLIVLKDLLK